MDNYKVHFKGHEYVVCRNDDGTFTLPPELAQWRGFNVALKPAYEPVVLARKPVVGTVAANVLTHGTGALNIDGCRVATGDNLNGGAYSGEHREKTTEWQNSDRSDGKGSGFRQGIGEYQQPTGRWPANVILQHSPDCVRTGTKTVKRLPQVRFDDGMKPFGDAVGSPYTVHEMPPEDVAEYDCAPGCSVAILDQQSGSTFSSGGRIGNKDGGTIYGGGKGLAGAYEKGDPGYGDTGGASRFFNTFEPDYEAPFAYFPKASVSEREMGLSGERKKVNDGRQATADNPRLRGETMRLNTHPTVKSVALMRHLVRLSTPPGGVVLDPFTGSGSTIVAAVAEGFRAIGIEREDEYIAIARARVAYAVENPRAFDKKAPKPTKARVTKVPEDMKKRGRRPTSAPTHKDGRSKQLNLLQILSMEKS